MKVYIRKNDTAVVISDRDKGKINGALRIIPKTDKIVVKGANLVKKHQRPNGQNIQGRITEMEAAVDSPKVMLFCEKYKEAIRIGRKSSEDGVKVRVCKKYGEMS